MISAEEYFKKEYGEGHIKRAIELNDLQSIYALMEEFADNTMQVKNNDLLHSVSVPLPDHYAGDLNTERIKAYRFEAEKYYIHEDTVGKIWCAGADWYKSKCNER